jgi:GAG-pre-integrase domain
VDSTLSSFLESSGVVGRSVEDLLLLHHRRLDHLSFSALSRLYPPLFEKANKEKVVCDACEFEKHTRSSYSSSWSRSFLIFSQWLWIQVHRCEMYFDERVLGAVLRGDRDVSPHPYVSRLVD